MTDLSLPGLQARLDSLHSTQSLTLARRQIERLFGHNDVAERQLSRFAQSHNCIIAHSDDCVVFEKVTAGR